MTSRGARYWSSGAIPLIAPDMLGDIIAAASDIAVVVTPEGRVLSVVTGGVGSPARGPAPGPAPIGPLDHWKGADLRRHLTPESVPKLDAGLAVVARGEVPRPTELNHTDAGHPDLPVRYSFHAVGPSGEVLMLGRDLRPVAEMQQRLVGAQMALERDYEAGRAVGTRYRVLLSSVAEPIAFASLSTGRILEINEPAAALLGARAADLAGAPLAGELDGLKRAEILEAIAAPPDGDQPALTTRARRSGRGLALRSVPFRSGGERLALLRIEAPGPDAADGGLAGSLDGALSRLFEAAPDAMAITDARGVIREANDAFLAMVEAAEPGAVRGRSLADFLARGAADLRVMTEAAAREGALAVYATRLATAFDGQVAAEISVTALGGHAGGGGPDGFAFVLRDAARADAVLGPSGERAAGDPGAPGGGLGDGALRSVSEMVGAAPLRDIVAETTDAVERLCIQTAVSLTGNNRVAAAEMLGLSRQSLYVKLRKYGLLARDGED